MMLPYFVAKVVLGSTLMMANLICFVSRLPFAWGQPLCQLSSDIEITEGTQC